MERNREHQGEHFTAAIAHHHLTLQTELKRSTSLPSAMFDANDPMLEARLCEATEGIFRRLLEHDTAPAPAAGGEVRLENVAPAELAALLCAAHQGAFADDRAPDLQEHADAEFAALIAEICARSHGAPQQRAADLLRGARPTGAAATPADIDALTHELAARLGRVAPAGADDKAAGADDSTAGADDDAATAGLLAICRQLAATVLRCTDGPAQERRP